MQIDRYKAAWKLRELEKQFIDLSAEFEDASSLVEDERFQHWKREVEGTLNVLKTIVPEMADVLVNIHMTRDDAHIIGELRRARGLLFLLASDDDDRTLDDRTLEDADQKTMRRAFLGSWFFRIPVAVCACLMVLLLFGIVQIMNYKVDIKGRVNEVLKEVEAKETQLKADLEKAAARVNTLEANMKAEIQKANLSAQESLGKLENTVQSEKGRIAQAADQHVKETLPFYAKGELQRVSDAVTRLINEHLPSLLSVENQRLQQAVSEVIERALPLHFEQQKNRIATVVDGLIATELQNHLVAVLQGLPKVVQSYTDKSLSDHLTQAKQRISEAAERLVANDLHTHLDTSKQQIVDAVDSLVSGPLANHVELQKQAISEATSERIAYALNSHVAVEKKRFTDAATRLVTDTLPLHVTAERQRISDAVHSYIEKELAPFVRGERERISDRLRESIAEQAEAEKKRLSAAAEALLDQLKRYVEAEEVRISRWTRDLDKARIEAFIREIESLRSMLDKMRAAVARGSSTPQE